MNASKMRTRISWSLAAVVLLFGCKAELSISAGTEKPKPEAKPEPEPEPEPVKKTLDELLTEAVESPVRTDAERERDPHRHPVETLKFAGLTPEMTVLELEPYDTWYTKVLGTVMGDRGKLIVTSVDPAAGDPNKDPRYAWAKDLADAVGADGFPAVEIKHVTDDYELGAPESVDLVISVRNEAVWRQHGYAGKVHRAVFSVLKPGGKYLIVTHRAPEPDKLDKKKINKAAFKGYVPQSWVIELVSKVGFEHVESSEINANPKDTKKYKQGVWALPPSLQVPEDKKAEMMAIGESDRMTLLFQKPGPSDAGDAADGDTAPDSAASNDAGSGEAASEPATEVAAPATVPAP